MSAFKFGNAYLEFSSAVRTERRWIFDRKTKAFLNAVRTASKSRGAILKKGRHLWRCQLGCTLRTMTTGEGADEIEVEEEWPHPASRMIPDPKCAKSGQRANPPGFVYLYLATRPETAMAEMRPWLGAWLSVSIFEVQRSLKLVVCQEEAEDIALRHLGSNPSVAKFEKDVWNEISRAFSRPVNRDDLESEYLPTQILAEVFRVEGFDGIAYQSGLAKGTNVVLFDRNAAKPLKNGYLYQFKKVSYTFVTDSQFPIRLKKGAGAEERVEITSESP